MESQARERRPLIALVGPGLMLAATGVGAGDLAGAAFAGMKLGTTVLWAVLLGAFFKYVATEGLARWQLATGSTFLEGSMQRFGPVVRWAFLVYLVIWSFGVGVSLASACGVAAHALFPVFEDPARAKVVFGMLHSLLGLLLVWGGSFRTLERLMTVLVAVMIVVVLLSGVLTPADGSAVLRGLFVPRIPDLPEAVPWTMALMGGVGGTLTVLCYGYWIREEGRSGRKDLALCRWDLGISYALIALFGIAMVLIADGMSLPGKGATLVVALADRLGENTSPAFRTLFLLGAWAAVFSSLLGVWQAVPYLFADFWQLERHRRGGKADSPAPVRVDTRGFPYRIYLIGLAVLPLFGLRYDFQLIQKLYAVVGALVMPMLALALMWMNGRGAGIGSDWKNRWWTTLALLIVLAFFLWVGMPSLLQSIGIP
ncbi:MAG: Nramp family divalent metal transporter [Verrucomicrobiae bacterium]|nr:Nramp family divalent metal transporter [Verrucomicrobiae bacterium]